MSAENQTALAPEICKSKYTMHKKKEAIKSEEKVQEGVIVKVQGEQDFTEETGDIKCRKDLRK